MLVLSMPSFTDILAFEILNFGLENPSRAKAQWTTVMHQRDMMEIKSVDVLIWQVWIT